MRHHVPLLWLRICYVIVNVLSAPTASARGPVACSRLFPSIKHQNAIGTHSSSYSIYMDTLNPSHKLDYTNTQQPFKSLFSPT